MKIIRRDYSKEKLLQLIKEISKSIDALPIEEIKAATQSINNREIQDGLGTLQINYNRFFAAIKKKQ